MKISVFSLAVVAFVMTSYLTHAQSPIDKIYEKYSGQDGFTAVNFTKEMFQMIQQMNIGDSSDADIKNAKQVVDQLTGVKVLMYKFDSLGVLKAVSIYNEFAGAYSSSSYKELMVIHEGRQLIKFLTKQETNNKISEFVMLMKDKDEVGVISLTGNIDLSSISQMSKFMNIKGMDNLKKMKSAPLQKH
jgi:Domain of unknown function (DUF4252)